VTDSPADPAAHSSAPTNERTAGRVTDPATGLTAAEVADRVARGLNNAIPSAPTRTVAQIVKANVFAPINPWWAFWPRLVIAAGSPKDALFGGVIIANSVIGVVQELRAKKVLDQLSVVNAPRAHAVRDGKVLELQVHELVLDDVVELRAGAQVVADGTVLTSENLEIDESLLTGEADPVVKPHGDEVLSGSAVVAGTGRVVVTKVGAENYAVKLAEEARRFTLVNSPLRNDVNRIVTWVGYLIIPVGLLLASSQFFRRDEGWRESIISTVAGLVGMVPEGLVLLTSVAFAVGVVRLAKPALPGAGAAGHRGARPRRCAVRRQDGHHHRRARSSSVGSATGRRNGGCSRRSMRSGRAGPARPRPQRHLESRSTTSLPRSHHLGSHRAGAVLLGSQVERDDLRRGHGSWVLGAPENVLTTAYTVACRSRWRPTPHRASACWCWPPPTATVRRWHRAALPTVHPRGAGAAGGHRARRRARPRCSTSPTRA
jgi:hypothetical protein